MPDGLQVVILRKSDASGTYVYVEPKCTLQHWEQWPEKTDVLCWNCCHGFSTRPIPLPVSYDEKRDVFRVMGNFCSWGCAKAHSRDVIRSMANRGSQAMALTLLRKRITGKTTTITPSPPRLLLKAFGGYMTIEEYRASHLQTEWTLPPPRLITQSQVVHDRKVGEHKRRTMAKTVDLSKQIDLGSPSTVPAVESLKLRRPKPIKKSSNMLEIALGLVSKE
jgi:hypothetical protein